MDYNGTVYKLILFLHLLAVVSAFGPLFLYSSFARVGNTAQVARIHMRMAFPALVLLWVLGMGLLGMSEDLFEVSQTWILLSLLVWVVLVAVSWFMIRPALRDDGEGARSRLAAGIGVTHLGLVAGLLLMVFKPGL
ncbi:MAG: hypothetical protein ACRD0A_16125 [Acidimicrobiales bacterium]